MIGTWTIRVHAANPQMPLDPVYTFVGSPSSVRVVDVPRSVGKWEITKVYVTFAYPDNSIVAAECVRVANVWVATLDACDTSGSSAMGATVTADGVDENGNAVTGYVLGKGDLFVLDGDARVVINGKAYYLHLVESVPASPKKGDVAKIDGVLKFYNGTAWEQFADLSNCATKADATLTERTGTAWVYSNFQAPEGWTLDDNPPVYDTAIGNVWYATAHNGDDVVGMTGSGGEDATSLHLMYQSEAGTFDVHADKIALQGYVLGSQADKPLASEAEAEALRTGKQDALSAQQLANIAAVPNKLDKSGGTVTGNLTVGELVSGSGGTVNLDYEAGGAFVEVKDYLGQTWTFGYGFLRTKSGYLIYIPDRAGDLALSSDIPYSLGTPIVIDTASSETVEGETVYYGEATLADRTANIVQVTAATALDELRITFPAATSGKVRDFGLRVEIGTGSAALTAPALVPIAPTGETIKIENNAKEIPALADGTATAKGVTLLYFSETAPGVFVVKGEQVEEVA